MSHFADRLADAVRARRTGLCVGLDPRWESLPTTLTGGGPPDSLEHAADAFGRFCSRVLDLVAPLVPAVKPQSAFFEQCGPAGMAALQRLLSQAHGLGLVTILDNKRGDIASTAFAYADAAFAGVAMGGRTFPVWDADAVTVNPYLGEDAVAPFVDSARRSERGLFVLVRTSNPGAGLFQDLSSAGRPVHEHVAEAVGRWSAANPGGCGLGDVGAVVGATHPADLARLRGLLPGVWLLVPGYGAQGATAADVAAAFRPDGLGAIVNSSRSVTFPFRPADPDWEGAIVAACQRAVAELPAVPG